MKLSIPLYKFPGSSWDNLLLTVKPQSIIANPGSGPGLQVSASYTAYLTKMKNAGVEVYGYVTNDKGRRSLTDIEGDIAKWAAWYGGLVSAPFFDELDNSGTTESVMRCRDLDSLRRKWYGQGKTYVNPGTKLGAVYLPHFDHAMVFEGYATDYLSSVRPIWESDPLYRNKVVHVVHSCSIVQLPLVKAKMAALMPGQGYITHDLMPNPWDNLPPVEYWSAVSSIPEPVVVPPAPVVTGTATLDMVVNGVSIQKKVTF